MCTDPKQKWCPDFARLRGLPYLAIAAQIEEAITLGSSLPATDCRRSARSPTIQVLAVVQIAGASKKRCIHHCIIVLKGLTSKQ
jgi:hypothetical protein